MASRRTTRRETSYAEQRLRLLPLSRFVGFGIGTGNAAPILGAAAATTYTGWSRLLDANTDEGATEFSGWPISFPLASGSYSSCHVNANAYITFGGTANVFSGINETNPSFRKILFNPGDLSYQRVYTKIDGSIPRLRWEGHSSYSGTTPGSSDRIVEFAFAISNGLPYVEVRVGNFVSPGGTLMIASTSASLASGTVAANTSYVFAGNAAGTTWTLTSSQFLQVG
jgi:hypothetical protein